MVLKDFRGSPDLKNGSKRDAEAKDSKAVFETDPQRVTAELKNESSCDVKTTEPSFFSSVKPKIENTKLKNKAFCNGKTTEPSFFSSVKPKIEISESIIGDKYIPDRLLNSFCCLCHDSDGKKYVLKSCSEISALSQQNFTNFEENFITETSTLLCTSMSNMPQFLNSSLLLKKLKGTEGIPQFVELIWYSGQKWLSRDPFLIMEYAEGTVLSKMMKQGSLWNWPKIKRLGMDLLEILSRIHREGIVHLDIHPGNIVITPEGKPVLIDFGSAQQLIDGETYAVSVNGIYTPPEQDGKREIYSEGNGGLYTPAEDPCPVGKNADLYAVGTIMRELLFSAYIEDIWRKLESSPYYDGFFMRMTAPRPEKRFQDASRMLDELKKIPDQFLSELPSGVLSDKEKFMALCSNTKPLKDPAPKDKAEPQTFFIGRYPQKFRNGEPEWLPIEWIAYPEESGNFQLVSRYILDYRAYDLYPDDRSWCYSGIRDWLKGGFLTVAFMPEEREILLPTKFRESWTPYTDDWDFCYGFNLMESGIPGTPVEIPDYVYLLSGKEETRNIPELSGETVYAGSVRAESENDEVLELTNSFVAEFNRKSVFALGYDKEGKRQGIGNHEPAGIRPVITVPADFKERYEKYMKKAILTGHI